MQVNSADSAAVEGPESKPSFANRASKKGQENSKFIKKSTKNIIGRIMPGDDSASEDEDDGEGNTTNVIYVKLISLRSWQFHSYVRVIIDDTV
jgi:hypothetical protein